MQKALRSKSTIDLLRLHGAILDALRERQVVRTANAPAGDYAEALFQKAFGWSLENNSASGHDATASDGKTYQIKCRRITHRNKSRQLSPIRNLKAGKFDYLAAVLFNEDYSIRRGIIIPRERLPDMRQRFSLHVNGHMFHLDDAAWSSPGVMDVTKDLQRAANEV